MPISKQEDILFNLNNLPEVLMAYQRISGVKLQREANSTFPFETHLLEGLVALEKQLPSDEAALVARFELMNIQAQGKIINAVGVLQ